jgi:2-keto-4-pentenoate hydratase
MDKQAIAHAARLLVEARRTGRLLASLPEACRPLTVADAHAIQSETSARLGEPIVGWKVAITPEGEVARGGLLQSRVVQSGASLSSSQVPLLGVEAEIAFRFERTLPPREAPYSHDEVAAAVTALLAIEVVDSRFQDYAKAPFLDRLADFMSNGAFVRGDEIAGWRALDLVHLDVELVIDGQSIVRAVGGHAARDPLLPAVALVNDLRLGSGVDAGMIITTGTYTGLKFGKPGRTVQAIFHERGSVTVRFL